MSRPLKTVRVIPELNELFVRAEEIVSSYFATRRDDPEHGTIEIFGQRYVMVRAASLSVELFAAIREMFGAERLHEADAFSRNLLFDLGHNIGKADAQSFLERVNLRDPVERMAAGPIHFAYSGWAFVDSSPGASIDPEGEFRIIYDHPYSFESDAWISAGRTADFPVCVMNAGYSSGWCAASFGIPLVASEILCRARGDDSCRFIMARPEDLEEEIARHIESLAPTRPVRDLQVPDFFMRQRVEEQQRQLEERERVEEQLRRTQKLAVIGRLAGGIAHDLNNTMSVILSRSALASNQLSAHDPLRAEIDEIIRAARQAANLTRNLLAFSRGQVLTTERIDTNALVAGLAELLRPIIGEDIDMVTSLSSHACTVEADRGQLDQVITNLVINARDALPSGGALRLETALARLDQLDAEGVAPGAYVTISVTDDGTGMDADTLAHAFEPFFTTKEDGTGLGLSTVDGIVKQAGGRVSVTSELGRGSRFTIWLPCAPAPTATETAPAQAVEAARPGETLLLVEDQPEVRIVLREILTWYGFSVHEASGPQAALELAAALPRIDAVITDVVMPQMGGREMAEKLNALRGQLKVIFMSGHAEDFALEGHTLEGGSAFLQKPFGPKDLVGTIRRLLDD